MKIREDSKSLFITSDGHIVRPTVESCFKKDDVVNTYHHEGSELYTVKNRVFKEVWRGTELSNAVKKVKNISEKKNEVIDEIPSITFDVLEEYATFLEFGYTNEGDRCALHQRLFKTLNGDRIRNRETKIGKTLSSLVCYALVCPICEISIDREHKCFRCGRELTRKDIKLNIEKLRKRESYE